MKKFSLVFTLIFLFSSCAPATTAVPVTETSTATIIPTSTNTSMPTKTPPPSITPTPTITLTPTLTPIAGGNKLALYCEVPKSGGYFEYDISTNMYTRKTNSWTSERHIDFTYKLSTFGIIADSQNVLNDEMLATCCTRLYAVSKDKKRIFVEKSGSDPTKFYWIETATGSSKIIAQFSNDGIIQELMIQPHGDYIALRMADNDEQNIYLINLQTGEIKDITSSTNSLPYAIEWTSDGLGLTYTNEEGIWLFSIEDFSQELLVKDGEDGDWSPDDQRLILTTKKGLEIYSSNGEAMGSVNSSSDRQVSTALFPEWVPVLGYNKIVYWDLLEGWILHDLNTNEQIVLLSLKDIPIAFRKLGYSLQWSPDGHWFLGEIIHSGGTEQVYLCDIDEGKCTPLDANTPTDEDYCRSGSWILPNER